MIVMFTDFGVSGPYAGQMKAVLAAAAPGVPLIDLMHDAPMFRPCAAAYLLAALVAALPPGGVVLGVVDPGVGRADRRPVSVRAGGRWFVGPDNGLFAIAARRAGGGEWREIVWRPQHLSSSFHGRDLFAPVAARLAAGGAVEGRRRDARAAVGADWPDDCPEVVYIDHYGNAITGIRASVPGDNAELSAAGVAVRRARVFSEAPPGEVVWYENSSGLAEISMNEANAAQALGLRVGSPVSIVL